MSELFWFLLPLAAASGWLVATRSAEKKCDDSNRLSNPAYFRGLSYLVNEEPDKAIDVFVQLLEVDTETVETHLALGSLFRRRGEVERAIRIHQNLIARPALSREQRGQALLELGKDYLRAGLFDRAEALFLELKDLKLYVRRALENLRIIYQQEKDWNACLKVAEELAPLVAEDLSLEKAHYYCELAEEALVQGETAKAEELLTTAVETSPQCIRAVHTQAKQARAAGHCDQAIALLHRTVELDPAYLPEALADLVECHKLQGNMKALQQYLGEVGNGLHSEVMLTAVDIIRGSEGDTAALHYLDSQLRRSPSLAGVLRLVELSLAQPQERLPQILSDVRNYLQQMLAERPAYQCTKCGFLANTLHWQCPSCRSFSTARRRLENEEKKQ